MQVIGNLVDNALRYTRTRVTLRAAPSEGPGLKISVVDDGVGIPPDRQSELFNKFVQLDRTSRGGGYRGTGLGLAICKEIVERHGGRIWVESGPNQGTAFHFELPLFVKAARQPAADASSFTAANCSYEYLAPVAPETEPQRILFRCPIHGNLGLIDGSVQTGVAKNHPNWIVQRDGKLFMEAPQAEVDPVPAPPDAPNRNQ